jgi:hypothetical protein
MPDSKRLAVLFADEVAIYEVLTGKKVFVIKRTTNGAYSRLKILNENTLVFDDAQRILCLCDIDQEIIIA